MHELSLAMSVLDIVENVVREHNVKEIREVEVEVGTQCGVEQMCFRMALEAVLSPARVVIVETNGMELRVLSVVGE